VISARQVVQRAREGAGALAHPHHMYIGQRTCVRCRTSTSYTTSHAYALYLRSGVLRCGCGGRLIPAYDRRLIEILTSAAETRLGELLVLAANTVAPDTAAGLERIRARTGGTPLPGGAAATSDDELGSQPS
jgi:hypothetical protein